MAVLPRDEGLRVVDGDDVVEDADERRDRSDDGAVDTDLESLRDEFIDGFNERDLDALLSVVAPDVECPDIAGDGAADLAEEVAAIWERSPGALLTRALLDGSPCAVAWLPDEDGCWSRAALVCFDREGSLLSLVAVPDDADALDRAEAEEPTGEQLEEWQDWSEWDRGEATEPQDRSRPRP